MPDALLTTSAVPVVATVPSRIPSTAPHHEPQALTAERRAWFRERAVKSRAAKAAALRGDGPVSLHPVNVPAFDPLDLMPPCSTSTRPRSRLDRTVARDRDTDAALARAGWRVVRVWEHEDPSAAADRVQREILGGASPRVAAGTSTRRAAGSAGGDRAEEGVVDDDVLDGPLRDGDPQPVLPE